jgi:hypothetical protein
MSPTPRATRLLAISIVAIALTIATNARAQGPDAAGPEPTSDEHLFAQGIDLRKRGRDAEALSAFERANAVHPSPRGFAQIALAHEAMAHWPEAEQGLLEALSHPDDPWIVRQRAYLDESLASVRSHLASLSVDANVAEAQVWVNGAPMGRLPWTAPMRVAAGATTLEVQAPGYPHIIREIHMEVGASVSQLFTFVAPAVSSHATETTPPPSATTSGEHTSPAARAAWMVAAAAGSLVLVGIAGAVTREWEAQVFNDDAQCGPLPGQSRESRCGTNRDIGNAAETISVAAFAGSGIAAAVWAYLLFHARASAPAKAASPRCEWTGLGVGCRGAF